MPIITHEDELELARGEKKLVSDLKKLVKAQDSVIGAQKKLAETVAKLSNARELYNRTMREVFKQMQTLARERASNVKDEEVNIFQELIHKNDEYIEGSNKWLNAIKDLAVRKEYFIKTKEEVADALSEMADKRSVIIKKALNVEKAKNKMIDGDKLNLLDQELIDTQRDFDRARDIYLKKIEQFLQVRDEINQLWMKVKEAIGPLS